MRAFDQDQQEIILPGAERDCHAIGAQQVSGLGIQHPAVEAVAAGGGSLGGACRFRGATPEDGADAGHKFAAAEGFGEVVVGAHLQADDLVHLLPLGGQHDDRDIAVRPDGAAQRQPVFAWQHEIEQDQVEASIGQGLAHGLAVGDRAGPESLPPQDAGDEFADFVVVIDDQNVRVRVHDGKIGAHRQGARGKIVAIHGQARG